MNFEQRLNFRLKITSLKFILFTIMYCFVRCKHEMVRQTAGVRQVCEAGPKRGPWAAGAREGCVRNLFYKNKIMLTFTLEENCGKVKINVINFVITRKLWMLQRRLW